MFGLFRKKPAIPLASAAEREVILVKQHPLFRQVDAAFHAYLEVLSSNPAWDDNQIERELVRRGVEAGLAEECVTFGPLAWGRDIVEGLGAKCSPHYRLHSMIDGSERELPLANEMVYAWARAMIGLYRTSERNEMFKLVALRSAEVDCINNALNGGISEADLRESKLDPPLIHFRHAIR